MDIGRAIRNRAREAGVTQADLCRATGLSASYMSMLMNSKIEDPQVKKIYGIAHAMGSTVDELVELAEGYDK
ncbi:helix-turn-helix domain-containing protein [Olsenella uli]|mgnify:CR=1 FL=1|uniref:helix-turn-helix domain-containing protein n=1 Tax=Olsenella uli TaxID=133926 RepID=UPI00241EB07E|nr:helix-turn-helix domain-containing protein [Olsenella uli]